MHSMRDARLWLAALLGALTACSRESSRGEHATDSAASSRPATNKRSGAADSGGESLPPGVKLEAGATIPNTDYVFRRVATSRGDAIWLDSMGRDRTRTRRAELALPPLAADERVMLASCDVNGRLDPFVIAVVVNETNVSRFTKIRQAWRANSAERTFDMVPVAGIVCEDPGS